MSIFLFPVFQGFRTCIYRETYHANEMIISDIHDRPIDHIEEHTFYNLNYIFLSFEVNVTANVIPNA